MGKPELVLTHETMGTSSKGFYPRSQGFGRFVKVGTLLLHEATTMRVAKQLQHAGVETLETIRVTIAAKARSDSSKPISGITHIWLVVYLPP